MAGRIRSGGGHGEPPRGRSGLSSGARSHQVLGARLEALEEPLDRRQAVDLSGRLVRTEPNDAWKAQGEARLVPARTHDDVKGDLDHDRRLDLAVAPEPRDRVLLEPSGHLGDLRVTQPCVRFAGVYGTAAACATAS